ncbi:ComEC/Rec2 family competence protein [Arthrobacter sp. Sa2CUA1]|uniref:ComEC/Rec2 family competence protein n=1 Tax=Arthrobacter gallicola TaxID=2762225 RepID=A0ABR8UPS8_9MICC|nr:ComEC/Rec2 family competence protein [Arthrobacter gallicola]MBD7994206.1 ComEC/Rec2 family competence protein [Arthrobacter gallicola]
MKRQTSWARYTAAAVSPPVVPAVTETDRTRSGRTGLPVSGAGRAREAAAKLIGSTGAPPPLNELRMVPVAAAAWIAAAVGIRLPAAAAFTVAGAGTAALMVLGIAVFSRRGGAEGAVRGGAAACLAPLAVVVLVAAAAGAAVLHRTSGPIHNALAGQGVISGEFRATGDARAGTPDRFRGEARYLVSARLVSFTMDGTRSTAQTPVLVIGSHAYADIRLGDSFTSAGTLSAADAGDPAAAVLRAGRAPVVVPTAGLYGTATDLRRNFAERSEGLGRTDAAALLPGMVLGDREPLTDDLAAAMKATGLTHLTAVSGANCSYLLAFVFLAARAVRLPRLWAAAAGLTVLAAFVVVVRPDPSVLRAAVMGSLGTVAVLSGRGKVPASLLCFCITVLLVIDPWLSGSYAFILSVCATAGLIVLGPRFAAALERVLPTPLAVLTAVPLAAQVTCAPVLILLQPDVPVYSVPANIAAAPAVPMITIVGMAAVILASVFPALALLPLWVAGAGAGWVAAVARFFAEAPGALLPWLPGATGAALMAAASAALVVSILLLGTRKAEELLAEPEQELEPCTAGRNGRGNRSTSGRSSGTAGRGWRGNRNRSWSRRWLAAGAAVLLTGAALVWWRPGVRAPAAGDWAAAACDVGQGDAMVIRTGPAAAIVIDAGPEPKALDSCLDALRINTVDLLVISHVHADHYAGAEATGDGRQVHGLAFSSAEPDLPREIDGLAAGLGLVPQRLSRGMHGERGEVQWQVLWPPAGGTPAGPGTGTGTESGAGTNGETNGEANENDASAVLLLQAAGLSFLFTGDIEEDAAVRLLQSTPGLRETRIDVLKVAHHGARNGGAELPAAVRPKLAVISVGAENTYGHPSRDTLETLEAAGAQVARTDLLGTFTLRTDGKRLIVERLRGG